MKTTSVGQFRSIAIEKKPGWLALVSLAFAFALTLLAGPAPRAQTYSVIHRFSGGADGAYPYAGVTLQKGILYGTTRYGGIGGTQGAGTVYQAVRAGSDWRMTPIYLFDASDGYQPLARVVFGPDGHPYGTTYFGGPTGGGLVFDLIPQLVICKTAKCFWKENELFAGFHGGSGLNSPGYGDLVWDSQGNIWGTAEGGGPHNAGGIFEITCSADGCTGAPIYIFSGLDGANPEGGVFLDGDGNVFATAFRGGTYGYGSIVELTYQEGLGWSKTYQYDFQNGSDGRDPFGGLISDGSGNLIGSTVGGGSGGGGTIFQLSPSDDSWTFSVLYNLPGSCGPRATLTLDSAGNLYGASLCGTNGSGNVFKLTKAGDSWIYTSLHDFDGSEGASPFGNVTIDTDGTLYGTTVLGGRCSDNPSGCGVLWMIKP